MKLMRSVKFSFENPRWWFASLMVMLASYVPILGHIVLMGYLSKILGKFVKTKNDSYEDFDFNKLGEYFKCGVYPFCTQMIFSLCFMMVLFLLIAVFVVIGLLVAASVEGTMNDDSVAILVFSGVGVLFISTMFFSFLMNIIIIPATIAAALTQGFKYSFSLTFIKGFVKRTWKEFLLVICFYVLIYLIIFPIMIIPGAVLLMYVILGPLMLMQWHIKWQLYKVYLEKGGEELPVKSEK